MAADGVAMIRVSHLIEIPPLQPARAKTRAGAAQTTLDLLDLCQTTGNTVTAATLPVRVRNHQLSQT